MSPKRQRLIFLLLGMVLLGISATLILSSFKDNLIFFYTVEDLHKREVPDGRNIRIGGLVEEKSLRRDEKTQTVFFVITDTSHTLEVEYKGLLPNLFREGQGVVAEGALKTLADGKRVFIASQILAKHDENYMPKDVADQLKKSGHWKYK